MFWFISCLLCLSLMGSSVLFDYATDYRRAFDIIKRLPSFSLCYLYCVSTHTQL